MIPVSYNARSLLVRKTSMVTTALGIALVVFALASTCMLQESIDRTLGSSGRRENAFVLRKGSDAELASSVENNLVGLVLAAPGVKKDAQGRPLGGGEVVVVVAVDVLGEDGKISNVAVRGVPDNVFAYRPHVRIIEGRPAQPGTDEVIIGKRIRGRFKGVDVGQSFDLRKNRPVHVVGVFEADGSSFESEAWADIETARSSFGRDGLVSSVTAVLESASRYDAFEAAIEHDKQIGLEAMRETEYYEQQTEGMSAFIGGLFGAITVLCMFGAIIGAVITMYAAVAQRRREIGTLLALGFSRSAVLVSFLIEAVLLSLAGGLVGVLASFAMSFVSFSMVSFLTWSEIVFTFEPTPEIVFTALAIGSIMGLLGGLAPALRAARTSPIQAMRD